MPAETLLAVAGIVLPAAMAQAAFGFGYALIAAPLLAIVVGPVQALPILWLTFLPATAALALRSRDEIRWATAWRMSLAGLPTTLIGAWVLRDVPPAALQAATGLCVLAFTLAPGHRRAPVLGALTADVLTGAIAGLLSATTGTNGPPLVLALSRRGLSQSELRATLACTFTALGLATLVLLALTGRLPGAPGALLLAAAPSLALGAVLGSLFLRRLPDRAAATAIRLLLLASGIACLTKALVP